MILNLAITIAIACWLPVLIYMTPALVRVLRGRGVDHDAFWALLWFIAASRIGLRIAGSTFIPTPVSREVAFARLGAIVFSGAVALACLTVAHVYRKA